MRHAACLALLTGMVVSVGLPAPAARADPPRVPALEEARALDGGERPGQTTLRIGRVEVSARALVTASARAVAVPLELRARLVEGEGAAPPRVSVRLCASPRCELFERVDLKVAGPGETTPAVSRRLYLPNQTFVISSWDGASTAGGTVAFPPSSHPVGLLGTFAAPVPHAGWIQPPRFEGDPEAVRGGLFPVPVGEAVQVWPDLVYGYRAVLLAPGFEPEPALLVELNRYLRTGGVIVAPAGLRERFLPRATGSEDARAVIDGEAALGASLTRVRLDGAPALATVEGGQIVRPAGATAELPVSVGTLDGGRLLLYEPEASSVELADALLATVGPLRTERYHDAWTDPQGWPGVSAAAVLLEPATPLLALLLGLLAWGALALLVLRRRRGRPGRALAEVTGLAAAVSALVIGGAYRVRSEPRTVEAIVFATTADAAGAVELGVRATGGAGERAIEAPPGSFAGTLLLGDGDGEPREVVRSEPWSIRTTSGSDAPVAVVWARPVRRAPGLVVEESPDGGTFKVTSRASHPYAYVVVGNQGTTLRARDLAAGASVDGDTFLLGEEDPVAPRDLVDAGLQRLVREVAGTCPTASAGPVSCVVGGWLEDGGLRAEVVRLAGEAPP